VSAYEDDEVMSIHFSERFEYAFINHKCDTAVFLKFVCLLYYMYSFANVCILHIKIWGTPKSRCNAITSYTWLLVVVRLVATLDIIL